MSNCGTRWPWPWSCPCPSCPCPSCARDTAGTANTMNSAAAVVHNHLTKIFERLIKCPLLPRTPLPYNQAGNGDQYDATRLKVKCWFLASRRGLKAGRRMELFALLALFGWLPLVLVFLTYKANVDADRESSSYADPRAPPGKRSAHRRLRLRLLGDVEDPAALRGGCRGTLGVLKLEGRHWLDRHVEKAANAGVG